MSAFVAAERGAGGEGGRARSAHARSRARWRRAAAGRLPWLARSAQKGCNSAFTGMSRHNSLGTLAGGR